MAMRDGGVRRQPDRRAASLAAQRPGLAYEEALAAQQRGDDAGALALIPHLPTALPDPDGAVADVEAAQAAGDRRR